MSNRKVIKAIDFDINKVVFSDNIKTNKYGGKSVYINYEGGPFRIQMPKMSLPFGVSVYRNPDNPNEVRYSLELSWSDVKPEILQIFKDFEEKIINYVEKNSKELFKTQRKRVSLEDSYRSYLKIDKDEDGQPLDKYAPRLKVKMYVDGEKFSSIDAYDSEKVNGSYPKIHLTVKNIDEFLSKGVKCETILQCSGLWAVGQPFGVSWVLAQIKIYKNENKLSGFAFVEDENEEVEHEEVEEIEEVEHEEVEESPELEEPIVKERKPRRKRDYLS